MTDTPSVRPPEEVNDADRNLPLNYKLTMQVPFNTSIQTTTNDGVVMFATENKITNDESDKGGSFEVRVVVPRANNILNAELLLSLLIDGETAYVFPKCSLNNRAYFGNVTIPDEIMDSKLDPNRLSFKLNVNEIPDVDELRQEAQEKIDRIMSEPLYTINIPGLTGEKYSHNYRVQFVSRPHESDTTGNIILDCSIIVHDRDKRVPDAVKNTKCTLHLLSGDQLIHSHEIQLDNGVLHSKINIPKEKMEDVSRDSCSLVLEVHKPSA